MRFIARKVLVCATAVVGLSAPLSWASLIPGSTGSTTITGNDIANASGSFNIQVDYAVYDGQSAGDPLGLTSELQLTFELTHLGDAGEAPALNFGRFIVFAPNPLDVSSPFYTSATAINQGTGGIAPSGMDIDPPPATANRGLFLFQDGLLNPSIASGQHSQLLVLTTPAASLPATVILEANGTNTLPSIHGDTTITLVPEPGSGLVFLGGFSLLFTQLISRRNRQIRLMA